VLIVEDPGLLLTVQDLGRPGYAHLGVPHSGAADRAALVRANRMVRNPDGAAGLEATIRGAVLRARTDLLVALTGAVEERTLAVGEGERLHIPPAEGGARVYLAVAGGLDVGPVLGSRSFDQLSGLGPAPLRAGDLLPVGAERGSGLAAPPRPARVDVLALLPGPRADRVDLSALPAEYVVTPSSNRIGVRLQGPALAHLDASELPSEGLVLGAVQVPPDGQPVIMLADHPTTGGYPVIGVVPQAQLATAAQLRPGDRITITLAAAPPPPPP
jgi:biotin-dependent carboxylase-like uncharacterized protein